MCVGKIKEKYFRDGTEYYKNIIKKTCPAEIIECEDEATPDKASAVEEQKIKETEGQRILRKIKDEDYVIALCIGGKQYTSQKWRERMRKRFRLVSGSFVFVIGGSLGLADCVIRRADETLSFSAMTFPHQMMRMVLCGQIAAAFSEEIK